MKGHLKIFFLSLSLLFYLWACKQSDGGGLRSIGETVPRNAGESSQKDSDMSGYLGDGNAVAEEGEGKKTDEEEEPSGEPAELEPETVTQPKDETKLGNFTLLTGLELSVGSGENQVAVLPGAEDELPLGPSSFFVDDDGSISILDNQNSAVKIFGAQGGLRSKISLGEEGGGFIDLSISKTGEVALARITTNTVHILPKEADDIKLAIKEYSLGAIEGFSGISFNAEGKLFARAAGQLTFVISDYRLDAPYLALLSKYDNVFFRTKLVSSSLGVLYSSGKEQAAEYRGNAERQYEISLKKPILSVSYIDTDKKGRTYLLVETDEGGDDEAINVKRYVVRVGDNPSDWGKPIEIPLDVYAFPFRDIQITADGTVYAMLVYQDKVKVMKWDAE